MGASLRRNILEGQITVFEDGSVRANPLYDLLHLQKQDSYHSNLPQLSMNDSLHFYLIFNRVALIYRIQHCKRFPDPLPEAAMEL